ncbi:Receptor expression-enhancing protein 5 [Anthophora quadrimaculata]
MFTILNFSKYLYNVLCNFSGSLGLIALYLEFRIGQQLLCNILGVLYPACCSMKALESKKEEDKIKWLTYWVVIGVFKIVELFTIVEFFPNFILHWFSVYCLFKCAFYIWLTIPIEKNGSTFLYHRAIRPVFQRYHKSVENFISFAYQDTGTVVTINYLYDDC